MKQKRLGKRIAARIMCLTMVMAIITLPAFTTEIKAEGCDGERHTFDNSYGQNDMEIAECTICHKKNIGYQGLEFEISSPVYNATPQTPTVSIKDGGTTLVEGQDYNVTVDSKSVVSGSGYPITITGKGDYAGTLEARWYLQRATPTIDLLAITIPSPSDLVYKKDVSKVVTVQAKNDVNGLGDITVRYCRTDIEQESSPGDSPSEAGTYAVYVTISLGANYNDIPSGNMLKVDEFTIEKADRAAPPAPTIDDANVFDTKVIITPPDDEAYEYSMDNATWQSSNRFEGLNPYQGYTFYQRYAETNNYKSSPASASKTVTTKKGTPTFTTVPTITGTYGTALSDMTLSKTADTSDNGAAGTWSITQSGANTIYPIVGGTTPYEITFTPSGAAYMPVTKMVVPSVGKKSISLKINDAERNYGETNPVFSIDQTGISSKLVGADTYESLGITIATTATKNSEVGVYPITANYTDEKYNITFVNGSLTIKKAIPSAEAIAAVKPNNLSAVCGSSLSSVSLPSVFQWTDVNTSITGGDLEAGQTIKRKAKYTPSDSKNYLSVDNVELNIVVTHSLDYQISESDHTKHTSHCSECNKDFAAGSHDFSAYVSNGDGTHKISCKDCGAVDSAQAAVACTRTEVRNKKDATCTVTGYTGDTYCKDCNAMLQSGSSIAALGHSYDNGVITTQPTTTAEGVKTFTCSRCGNKKTEAIAKLPDEVKPSNDTKPSDDKKPVTPPAEKIGEEFASYQGNEFTKSEDGKIRCYDEVTGEPVIDEFKCDGEYTYYLQADGTAMTDCLTYHPDGEHVIYFDESGHEVFSEFAHITKTISGETVDDYYFFDSNGSLYVDVVTYDKTGTIIYYINEYGIVETGKWFQFSPTAKWAGFTEPDPQFAGKYGYANADMSLMVNQITTDWEGRLCYIQGNGVALY